MNTQKFTIITLVIGVSLIFTNCKTNQLSPLSKNTIRDYKLSKSDLQQLQFYTSEEIILVKINQEAATSISDGSLKQSKNRKIDEVIIPANTPGVVRNVTAKNHLEVNFDPNNPECVILFGPNPNKRNQYVMLAKEWNRNTGVIPYCGKKYKTSTSSSKVTLLLNKKKSHKTKVKRTKVEGSKVS